MSRTIRQGHRWLSILFALSVVANLIAFAIAPPPMWLVYAPLPPLFLLMASGLYLFALPHVRRGRREAAS